MVKTGAADDHDRQGTKTKGFGQFVAAKEAIFTRREKTCLTKRQIYLI